MWYNMDTSYYYIFLNGKRKGVHIRGCVRLFCVKGDSMKLIKKDRVELQMASRRLTNALYDTGYIKQRDRDELLYRVAAGDMTAYTDLKGLLVEIAEQFGRM